MPEIPRLDWFIPYELAERGLAVFPLVSGGKRPALKGWQQESTTRFATISCWQRKYGSQINWGIDCGKSGIVAVDVDTKREVSEGTYVWTGQHLRRWRALLDEHYEVPQLVNGTGSGGFHYLWEAPAVPLTNRAGSTALGLGIDIRVKGGLIVAPGSWVKPPFAHRTATGHYSWFRDGDLEPCPAWLVALLQGDTVPTAVPIPRRWREPYERWFAKNLAGTTADVASALVSKRRDTLNEKAFLAAGRLAGVDAPRDWWDAYRSGFIQAAISAGLSEKEATRTVDNAMRDGAVNPVGLPGRQRIPREPAKGRKRCRDWLDEFLPGPVQTSDVVAAGRKAGYSRSSIFAAASKAETAGRLLVIKDGRRTIWEPVQNLRDELVQNDTELVQNDDEPVQNLRDELVQNDTELVQNERVQPDGTSPEVSRGKRGQVQKLHGVRSLGTSDPVEPMDQGGAGDLGGPPVPRVGYAAKLDLDSSADEQPLAPCGHAVGRHGHGGAVCTLCRRWHEVRRLPWPCPGSTPEGEAAGAEES